MIKTLFLLSIFVVLLGFLACRRTPRRVAFETVFISVWTFATAYWLTEVVMDRFSPDLLDGSIPLSSSACALGHPRCVVPAEGEEIHGMSTESPNHAMLAPRQIRNERIGVTPLKLINVTQWVR